MRKVEEMHREALEVQRRVLGLEHQDTLASMSNLANVLQEQGQWQEAEQMYREVLEVQRRVLGLEHPNTLASMNNLAIVLQEQGRWKEAEQMHREVPELRRRVLGLEHQDTLASMSNLANVLQEQGQWQEAEQMYREVLEVQRRVLGLEHPNTLASMNNLAIVLQEQGRWKEAEQMHREVPELRRRVLGLEHQDTLASMNAPAALFEETWKAEWKEAKELWHNQKGNLNKNQQERDPLRHVETSFLGQELGPSFDQQHWGTSPYMGWAGHSQDTQQLQLQQHFQTQGYHPSMVQGHSCMPSSAPIPPGSVPKQPQSTKTKNKKVPKPEKSQTSQSQMKDPERSGHRGHKAETFERLLGAFSFGKAGELGEHDLVKESGFESEVQNFLNDDPKFPCACLAGVSMLADHSKENPGVSHSDTETAGIVVIKSNSPLDSSLVPCRISCGIWQKKDDARLTRHIKSEVIVQIYGQNQKPQDGDLQGVEKPTVITAEFRCFNGTNDEDAGDPTSIDLKDALAPDGLDLLQKAFKSSNIELSGAPVDFSDYCDILNRRSNVPKPQIREKLLAGNTDSLCFLIRHAKELSDLNMVKESGFQTDVQKFLNDPDLTWTCLAGVRKPDYQSSECYDMSDNETKTLGVVAIKSSKSPVPVLRISAGIWLRKKNLNVIRRINAQIVLQVFGGNPMHRNHDVRRNHHTMEDVFKNTPIEAVVRCFCDDSHKGEKDENEEGLVIKLNQAVPDSLQKAFESLHFTLTGQEQDFSKYADLVAKRLKARPEVDKCFKWKTIKDFKGSWLPGNLFKFTLSEQLSCDLEKTEGYRKELDGHIVVLLPPLECPRSLVEDDDQVLVAPLDSRRRAVYVVPRINLQPVSDQDSGNQQQPDTDKLKDYLTDKYKFKVLVRPKEVRPEDRWPEARLCLGVAGRDRCCIVQFDDGKGSERVNASDLRLAKDLTVGILGEGREAATLLSSQQTGQTNLKQRALRSVNLSEVLKDSDIIKHFASGFADSASFLQGDPTVLSKELGFQSEVQEFLKDDDPEFPWACLAVVSEPADQSNEADNQTKALGVVAIKSSSGVGTLLKIRAGIWLRREDRRVLCSVMAQIVFRVFGKASPHEKHDVRRNRFTLRGVGKTTPIEAHLCCFIKNEESQQIERPQPEMDRIDLKNICGTDGSSLLRKALLSLNLTLTGEEQDFLDYADVVAQMKVHLVKQLHEGAPEVDKRLEWPKWQTIKDFKGSWLPGNLFKFRLPEHLSFDLEETGGYQKDLDGCIVVLLPWNDCHGSLQLKEEEAALVAAVDSRRRAIYLVPRIALHPVSTDGKQLQPGTEKPKELTKYLQGKYQYKVLARSGDTWENPRKARLCLEVVGGDRCMVQFEDEGEQAKPKAVNVSDLRLAKDLKNVKSRGGISAGHDRRTILSSEATTATV